jgi:hypothetical protein
MIFRRAVYLIDGWILFAFSCVFYYYNLLVHLCNVVWIGA